MFSFSFIRSRCFVTLLTSLGVIFVFALISVFWGMRYFSDKAFSNILDLPSVRETLQSRFQGNFFIDSPKIADAIVCSEISPLKDETSLRQTQRIQEAIDACTQQGGGIIRLQKGEWYAHHIELRSNIGFELVSGAELNFVGPEEWDMATPRFNRFEGIELYSTQPLLSCTGCQDVRIFGQGVISGSGSLWQSTKGILQKEANVAENSLLLAKRDVPVEERVFLTEEQYIRPDMFLFVESERVLVEGVTIKDSPRWTLHFVYGSHIQVKNVHIDTDGPNTDGIVFDSVENALAENISISSGDDAIVLKSGRDEDGWRVNRPTQNITLRGITIEKAHGGITIGSEMSGGIRNVYAQDVSVNDARVSARIKAPRGRGGYVENVFFKNFLFHDMSESAISVEMDYSYNVDDDSHHFPRVEKLFFESFSGDETKKFMELQGFQDAPIEYVYLWNSDVYAHRGFSINYVNNLHVFNSLLEIHEGKQASQKKAFIFDNVTRTTVTSTTIKGLPKEHYVRCGTEKEATRTCQFLMSTQKLSWFYPDSIRENGFIFGPEAFFYKPSFLQ